MAMHWWTLIVGVLLGAFVLPMITKALGGMSGSKSGG